MSPRKLTEDDKQEILQLYRNSEATTSTLATRYEVSSSTISRFLKNKLSSTEYEDLIQQKRLARTPRGEKSADDADDNGKTAEKSAPKIEKSEPPEAETKTAKTVNSRRRRRSSSAENTDTTTELDSLRVDQTEQLTIAEITEDYPDSSPVLPSDRSIDLEIEDDDEEEEDQVDLITLKEMLGEELEDINEEDDDDWDDDEDDEDDEDDGDEEIIYASGGVDIDHLEILPLSQAIFPRTCYLVIDRSAELIVKPLADFADLGAIPQEEIQETTLPVFDNHRIAKRFSHRRERVIKVPDGRMLQKTSRYLQDKGITRLLIDGQIYSLSN